MDLIRVEFSVSRAGKVSWNRIFWISDFGFRGLGFRFSFLFGFRVSGSGVQDLGPRFRDLDFGVRVFGSGIQDSVFKFLTKIWDPEFREILDPDSRVSGFGAVRVARGSLRAGR